jgi:SAM-dependent MidA family methyltransferase
MSNSLLVELRERIRSSGPMPFSMFMERSLYHPSDGYYATRVPGHDSHYRTSPSITPWFGRLVAHELRSMWESLDEPDPFWVVEVGGGLGDLAAEAIGAAEPLAEALRWRFVERFGRVREWQVKRLGRGGTRSRVVAGSRGVSRCDRLLANEVLDNFPVHVLEIAEPDEVWEVYVDVEGDRFVERLGRPSAAPLTDAARRAAAHLTGRARLEITTELEGWFRQASQALQRGYLLLVDYGDVEPDLWLDHPGGTLATYGPVDLSSCAVDDPGRKDITVKVNFSAVERAARAAGFCPLPLLRQRDWLLSLGLPGIAEELELAGFQAALDGWVEHAMLLQLELDRLLELGAVGGLGDLLVFRATKGHGGLTSR